ncbi:MAG: hypothetical protein K2N58_10040 [Treponemataceae bacterium]|nr:hypothetical protein [Treponemataceae bacterium]
MKKNFAFCLIIFIAMTFAFADKSAEKYLSNFEALVVKIESYVEENDYWKISSVEAQKEKLDSEKENLKLSFTQRLKNSDYEKRYNAAYEKLKNLYDEAAAKRRVDTTALKGSLENLKNAAENALESAGNVINEKAGSTIEKVGSAVTEAIQKGADKTADFLNGLFQEDEDSSEK